MPTRQNAALQPGRITLLHHNATEGSDPADTITNTVRHHIDHDVPVVYIECGSDNGWGPALAEHLGHPALLHTVNDEDEVIWLPEHVPNRPDLDNAIVYALGNPTFTRLRKAIQTHTTAHGPCLVIIDAIERARPFSGIDEEPADPQTLIQDSLKMSPAEIRHWRNTELQRIAQDRPDTPTLVITYDNTVADRLHNATTPTDTVTWRALDTADTNR